MISSETMLGFSDELQEIKQASKTRRATQGTLGALRSASDKVFRPGSRARIETRARQWGSFNPSIDADVRRQMTKVMPPLGSGRGRA